MNLKSNGIIPIAATKKAAADKLNELEKNYRGLEINCSVITRKLQDALGDMTDLDDRLKEVRSLLVFLLQIRVVGCKIRFRFCII